MRTRYSTQTRFLMQASLPSLLVPARTYPKTLFFPRPARVAVRSCLSFDSLFYAHPGFLLPSFPHFESLFFSASLSPPELFLLGRYGAKLQGLALSDVAGSSISFFCWLPASFLATAV